MINHSWRINKIDSFRELQDDVREYLREVTNCSYSFAVTSKRIWGRKPIKFGKNEDEILEFEDEDSAYKRIEDGQFYQLMPDGLDEGFFNWYCRERMYNQFFTTKEMCVASFLKFYIIWISLGKPKR